MSFTDWSPDFEASIFNPTELHQIFRCRTICLMLSVSVATRTESLVNRSSPTCESFVFDRALSLRLTEQLSIYASLWSWSLFITPWRGRRNLVMSQWNLPNPPLGFVIFWGTPPPPLNTHKHFIGSQFSIFLTFYSVSNDWFPPPLPLKSMLSPNILHHHPHPHPQATDWSLTDLHVLNKSLTSGV